MPAARGVGKHRKVRSGVVDGAVWSGVSVIVMRVVNLALMVVVVRLVTPHEFGVFTAALVVGAVAQSISEMGAASALIRRDLDADALAPTVAGIAWAWSALLSLGMAGGAELLAAGLGVPDAAAPIRVLAISIAISGLCAVSGAFLAREFRQRSIFLAGFSGTVASGVVLVVLAADGGGAMAFAWSRVVAAIVTGALVVLFSRHWVWPRISREQLRPVVAFGLPLAGANLLGYILLNADSALVGRWMGAAALGVYAIAFSVSSLTVSTLSSVLNSVSMPAFSEHTGSDASLAASVRRWGQAVFTLGLPVSAFTVLFAHEIVSVLYGPQWLEAAGIVTVLALYGLPMLFELMLSNLLVAMGRTGLTFIVQSAWLAALVGGMAVGLAVGGLQGVAWAHVVVLAVVVLPVQMRLLARVRPGLLRGLWRTALRPAAGAAAAVGTAALAVAPLQGDVLRIAVGGCAGLTAYLAIVGYGTPALRGAIRARWRQGRTTGTAEQTIHSNEEVRA